MTDPSPAATAPPPLLDRLADLWRRARHGRRPPAELDRIRLIRRRLVRRDDPVIVEIGAARFRHTRMFLDTFPKAFVHCFEPQPEARQWYAERIGPDEPRCRFYDCAVGDRPGEATMSIGTKGDEFYPGASSIAPTRDHSEQYPWLHFARSIEVPVTTLDTWSQTHGVDRADFIWTDVQGSERSLVDGATRFLERVDFIQLEYGEIGPYPETAMTRQQTIDLLATRGFELASSFPQGHGPTGDLVFVNRRRSGAHA